MIRQCIALTNYIFIHDLQTSEFLPLHGFFYFKKEQSNLRFQKRNSFQEIVDLGTNFLSTLDKTALNDSVDDSIFESYVKQ